MPRTFAEAKKLSLLVVIYSSLEQASHHSPALPVFPQTVRRSVTERYGVA
jgi:hypothetical protein